MQVIAILLCSVVSWSAFATETEMVEIEAGRSRFAAGTGIEGRANEDVNPEVKEGRVLPHFFAQYRFQSWAASLEGGYERRESSSGALSINTTTYQLGLWGRREFGEPLHWSPFAGLGAGYFFDQVTSSFQDDSVTRNGRRGFWGVNGGVSHSAWKHLLMEAELRAALVQDRKDVAYSAILRVGFVL